MKQMLGETITVKSASHGRIRSEDNSAVVRLNITMPSKLKNAGVEKAGALFYPSFSAYLQELVRCDCGLLPMLKTRQ